MGRVRRFFTLAVLVATGLALALPGSWGTAQAAVNLNVHVHDDFYHPAGAFLVGSSTDHNLAKAACQKASPEAACDAVIAVGDTITWVAPAPLAVNAHSVTECTDGTFSVCGPAVSAANPIGDSGTRSPPPAVAPTGWPYGPITFTIAGVYYYRCEVHPDVMRGRIVVQALEASTVTPTLTPLPLGGSGVFPDAASGGYGLGSALLAAMAAGAAAGAAALGGAAWYARRRWSR